MQSFLDLTLADGQNLLIPSHLIMSYEQVPEGQIPNFPDARTFVRYDLGNGQLQFGLCQTDIAELERDVGTQQFLRLEQSEGDLLYVRPNTITSVLRQEDGNCQVVMRLGEQLVPAVVRTPYEEIRDAIKPKPTVQ